MTAQPTLFRELGDDPRRLVPEGFRYQEEIISKAEEVALAASLTTLELKPFEFHGHLGNRRVISFGLRYDYARRTVEAAQSFPAFVIELRNKVAKFAGREVEEFQQGGVRIPSRRGDRLAQGQARVRRNRRRLTFSPRNDAFSTP